MSMYAWLEIIIKEANKKAIAMGCSDRTVSVSFDVFHDHRENVDTARKQVRLRYRRVSGAILYEKTIILGIDPDMEEIEKHKNEMASDVISTLIIQKTGVEVGVALGAISFF